MWYKLVNSVVQHWVDRYTLKNVSQWYFEVFNEVSDLFCPLMFSLIVISGMVHWQSTSSCTTIQSPLSRLFLQR